MDPISKINIGAGILMAALCFGVLAVTLHREGMAHIRAFLMFWALNAIVGVLDRLWNALWPFYHEHSSLQWAVDALSNMAVIIAAYALYRGARFAWNDRTMHAMCYAVPVLFAVEFGLGLAAESDKELVWRLFYTTPGAFIATVALACVAIGVFREPLVRSVRWPLVILFGLYAYLQIPAYVCDFIQADGLGDQIKHGQQVIVAFLATTKVGLSLSLLVVVWAHMNAGSPEKVDHARLGLTILSSALAIFVFFYRIVETLGITKMPTS
jgi:hypothetical protein